MATKPTEETTQIVPKRKKPRKVEHVKFELPDWDRPFNLPNMNRLSQGQQWAIASGDSTRLRAVLGDYVNVLEDMEDAEVEAFMEAWATASGTDLGESAAASVI